MPLIAWVIVVAIIVAVIDHFLTIAIFPGIFPLSVRF
jgi:hypothetical protein